MPSIAAHITAGTIDGVKSSWWGECGGHPYLSLLRLHFQVPLFPPTPPTPHHFHFLPSCAHLLIPPLYPLHPCMLPIQPLGHIISSPTGVGFSEIPGTLTQLGPYMVQSSRLSFWLFLTVESPTIVRAGSGRVRISYRMGWGGVGGVRECQGLSETVHEDHEFLCGKFRTLMCKVQ